MISAAEGGGGGSSSFRFRTRSRFRRTALRVPPDILCDKKIKNQNRLYDGIKDKKDMMKMERIIMRRQRFIDTRDKSGSITATPGWKTRKPREEGTDLLQGTQDTKTLATTTVLRLQGSNQRDVLERHR